MKRKNGITLVTLVVTIIVLLLLAGISTSFALGPDGIIEKSRNSKLDSRYGAIMDKVKIRETANEMAFAKNEEGEH